jgi:hypothetical protein
MSTAVNQYIFHTLPHADIYNTPVVVNVIIESLNQKIYGTYFVR